MLENAINACPDDQWDDASRFLYIAYHTAFWTDYYLSDTPMEKDYRPPTPFTLSEFEDDQMPEREHGKSEVLAFLHHARQRLQCQLQNNNPEELLETHFVSEYRSFSFFELLLYNMRHVQHHAAQLNLLLRQGGTTPPDWVSREKENC
ncbi:hypothetical protein Niako_3322 [Niastella koreensis GR20-10]|uniref:Uncharacterized protein n=1 Tax=Niastella koreensis (strain DSM 17620 / KACC 11465 / NBRC 106392 / GR20-10) TaxID=700598 RepID=G8TI34_NIAKG|nr:DinB family protein [Niastella koreensis]AEV99637.1 hypothetical protein Niako_3322 [Niastella koreensis GR20-10]